MEIDTPNVHTPPEGHSPASPPPPQHHAHDMEDALHDCGHAFHEEPPIVILDRRFAKGEMTKSSYIEAKELLLRK